MWSHKPDQFQQIDIREPDETAPKKYAKQFIEIRVSHIDEFTRQRGRSRIFLSSDDAREVLRVIGGAYKCRPFFWRGEVRPEIPSLWRRIKMVFRPVPVWEPNE